MTNETNTPDVPTLPGDTAGNRRYWRDTDFATAYDLSQRETVPGLHTSLWTAIQAAGWQPEDGHLLRVDSIPAAAVLAAMRR
jgi:hypothetical protein